MSPLHGRTERATVQTSTGVTGPAPTGEVVSGGLLDAQPQPQPEAQPAAGTGRLEEEGGGIGVPGAALGLVITVGLMGAGALVEARSLLG